LKPKTYFTHNRHQLAYTFEEQIHCEKTWIPKTGAWASGPKKRGDPKKKLNEKKDEEQERAAADNSPPFVWPSSWTRSPVLPYHHPFYCAQIQIPIRLQRHHCCTFFLPLFRSRNSSEHCFFLSNLQAWQLPPHCSSSGLLLLVFLASRGCVNAIRSLLLSPASGYSLISLFLFF